MSKEKRQAEEFIEEATKLSALVLRRELVRAGVNNVDSVDDYEIRAQQRAAAHEFNEFMRMWLG